MRKKKECEEMKGKKVKGGKQQDKGEQESIKMGKKMRACERERKRDKRKWRYGKQ